MSWQLLIGLSIALYSINDLLHRTIMKNEGSDGYAQSIAFTALGCVVFWIILILRGSILAFPTWDELTLFITSALLSSAGMVFTFKGFQKIGASEHTVLLTTTQVWVLLGAVIVLKEQITLTKLAGAAAILLGVIVAESKKGTFVFGRGAIYVLLSAYCFGVSSIISFFIIREFDLYAYMAYSSLLVAVILIIAHPKTIKKLRFYLRPRNAVNVVITSINDAFANIFGFIAYQVGRNALEIGPIMATQTIVTVLLAALILHERDRLPQKIIGAVVAVAGTVLLI